MQEARFYLDTPRIMALTVAVIALSAAAEAILQLLEAIFPGDLHRVRGASRGVRVGGEPVGGPPALQTARGRADDSDGDEPSPRLVDVSKRIGGVEVLRDVSLELARGLVTVVLGPSGCGKTTLLRLIAGLDGPDSGRIDTVGDVSLAFQEPRLLPWADLGANIGFVAPGPPHRSQVIRVLSRAGLEVDPATMPGTLSGGMRQRVSLARAFSCEARTLLLDEPFQNLDLRVKIALAGRVREMTRDAKSATLMVTHDVVEALSTGDRIVVLYGRPASIVAERSVTLTADERDPRSDAYAKAAADLYDLLLSAR
jgi:ABC-type nitrate/sulfonate/bicarbonate transport system ATPase subunit